MQQRTVHLFVMNTLADWEPGYAVAGINSEAFQAEPGTWRVLTVGETLEPVKTVGGITIQPDVTLDEVTPTTSAMLILPGGDSWAKGEHTVAIDKARTLLDAGVPVAGICGATVGLARAGLLNDRRHTSNAQIQIEGPNYEGSALYQEQPAVIDRDLITAGATHPVQFAYEIFKRLGIYDPKTLEAWLGLYTTGDPAYFFALAEGAQDE